MEVEAGGEEGALLPEGPHCSPGGLNRPPSQQGRLPACPWGGATWCQLKPSHQAPGTRRLISAAPLRMGVLPEGRLPPSHAGPGASEYPGGLCSPAAGPGEPGLGIWEGASRGCPLLSWGVGPGSVCNPLCLGLPLREPTGTKCQAGALPPGWDSGRATPDRGCGDLKGRKPAGRGSLLVTPVELGLAPPEHPRPPSSHLPAARRGVPLGSCVRAGSSGGGHGCFWDHPSSL